VSSASGLAVVAVCGEIQSVFVYTTTSIAAATSLTFLVIWREAS